MAERGKASGCWLGRLQNGGSARMRSLMPAPPTHTPSSKTALRMLCQISQILQVRRWKSMTDTPRTAVSRPSPQWEQCTASDLAHRSCSVGWQYAGKRPHDTCPAYPYQLALCEEFQHPSLTSMACAPRHPMHQPLPYRNRGEGHNGILTLSTTEGHCRKSNVGAPQCEGGHCQETPTKVAAVPVTHRNLWHQAAAASGTVQCEECLVGCLSAALEPATPGSGLR